MSTWKLATTSWLVSLPQLKDREGGEIEVLWLAPGHAEDEWNLLTGLPDHQQTPWVDKAEWQAGEVLKK